MPSEKVRKLAREEPEAFRSVAEKKDDQLQERMLSILREENQSEASRQRVPADD